jgi:hypothetical protein
VYNSRLDYLRHGYRIIACWGNKIYISFKSPHQKLYHFPTNSTTEKLITDMTKIYVVEHLDPELEAWSSLEYSAIATETHNAGSSFLLSSVPPALVLPANLRNVQGLQVKSESVEELFQKSEVCLLDPSAEKELSPEDGETFSVFLFGGILGRCALWKKSMCYKIRQIAKSVIRG